MRRPTSRPAHAAPNAGARIRKGRLLVFLLVMVVLFGNVVRNCVSDHADRSGAQPRPPAVTSPR